MAIVLRVWFRHLSLKFIASSTAPAVNSLLEWVQQNKAYDIRDTIDYSNSNMHSTAGAVERVKINQFSAILSYLVGRLFVEFAL